MKLIDKYIFKEFLIPFRYCFLSFVIIFIVGDLFENLDNFIIEKVPWILICRYYLYLIPTIFVLTTPLTVLLSILYELGYMSRHNEIVALKASGISFWRIIISLVIIGIIISVLLFIVNEKLVPKASRRIDYIREAYIKKIQGPDTVKHENITFFSSLYNISVYVDRIYTSGHSPQGLDTLEGISIREFNKDGSLKREWYAKKAIWVDSSWWLFDGYIRSYMVPSHTKDVSRMQFFKKCHIPVDIFPSDLICSQKDLSTISNYMDVSELYRYLKRNFTPDTIPKEILVDLYKKLSIPFTVIVVTILGISFGGRISSGGALASVGLSLAFYLAYYGINSFFIAMGKVGRLIPGLAVWTPHIIFGILGISLLRKTK